MDNKVKYGRADYRAWRTIPTRWMDNDVYGHVNNVIYYSYFDTVVNGWLMEQGLLDYEHGETVGLVVETGCTYHQSIAFPQEVEAGIAVTRLGRSSVRYEVGLFIKGEDEPAAQGYFVHVYVGHESRRPQPLPDNWRAALTSIMREAVAG